ncbi:MAG TPA: hypothetical protein VKT32_13700, partial [Chthonomonadaceae bacterium]|nr:hypothetical protein [Chthonomonadaceae bacterium]
SLVGATTASHMMDTHSTDLVHLSLLTQRLLDAEVLFEAEGAALLEMLQQAQQRLASGETGEAEGLLLGFEALLKALTDSGVLDPSASELCLAQVRAITAKLNS